jgi:hypothetical protein
MRRNKTGLVRVGRYVVDIPIELIVDDGGLPPYLSLEDAEKLESAHLALQRGDLAAAAQLGRVYELRPVSV